MTTTLNCSNNKNSIKN